MPTEMTVCPHCGTSNSVKRHLCFQCQQEIAPERPAAVEETADAVMRRTAPVAHWPAASHNQTNVSHPSTPTTSRSSISGESLKQRAAVYRKLAGLLHAGIPTGQSLAFLEENIALEYRPMIRRFAEFTQHGGRLSLIMAEYPHLFPEWEIAVVQAAETGGTLATSIRDLAEALETEMALRSEVNSRTWHLKITSFAFVLVLLICLSAYPIARYANFDTVEESTRNALKYLSIVGVEFLLILAGSLGLWQLWRAWGRTIRGAQHVQTILLRLPVVGPLLRNVLRLRFSRVLTTLWRAGVAPMEAMEIAAQATGNHHLLEKAAARVHRLGRGEALGEILDEMGIFPRESMYLVRSGEMGGAVPESLEKVSEYTQLELETQLSRAPVITRMLIYAILAPLVLLLVAWTWHWFYDLLIDRLTYPEPR